MPDPRNLLNPVANRMEGKTFQESGFPAFQIVLALILLLFCCHPIHGVIV